MAKRRGQWYGDSVAKTVNDIPLVADVVQILPSVASLESVRDVVFERCIIAFCITRLSTASVTDCYWMAYHGYLLDGSSTPTEALNPRSASSFTLAHGSIMQFGALTVPPVVKAFDSAGVITSFELNSEVQVVEVDFDVKRSLNRGNEAIMLTMAASAQDVISVRVGFRTYYTYA